jgi:hypothetical protein
MVHNTAARKEARGLKERAQELAREARALDGIEDAASLVGERQAESARLGERASELQERARLEDLSVMQEPLIKVTKKGERKEYWRWVAAWRVKGKYQKVYVGSCKRMDQAEALRKARRMKAEALGMADLRE